MASDTVSERNDESDLVLTWSGRWTLAHRILAVNMLTLVLVALGDRLPRRLPQPAEKERVRQGRGRGAAWPRLRSPRLPPAGAKPCSPACRSQNETPDSASTARTASCDLDSWQLTGPTYRLRDPATQKWNKDVARALDRGFNALVGEENAEDFVEPAEDQAAAWREVRRRRASRARSKPRSATRPT